MDITVTTPLEMNVGQQKYVVAYTLKQGTEKQPDILNAQKSQDSIDSVNKMGSPAVMKPDGLFSATLSSSSSKNMKSSEQQQQHSTPPSHHSTLKYNDNGSKGYMALNQTIASNYSAAQPPSYCSTMMNDFETPLNYTVSYNSTSGTSNISNSGYHHHKMSPDYNNLNNLYSGSTNGATTSSSSVANNTSNLHLGNELLENSDGFLDFDKTLIDGSSSSRRYCTDTDGDYKYSKDQTNHHQSQQQHLYTGCDYTPNDPTVEYKNLANQIANTISNINSTLTRSRNRNHILTDNLPGPESCV